MSPISSERPVFVKGDNRARNVDTASHGTPVLHWTPFLFQYGEPIGRLRHATLGGLPSIRFATGKPPHIASPRKRERVVGRSDAPLFVAVLTTWRIRPIRPSTAVKHRVPCEGWNISLNRVVNCLWQTFHYFISEPWNCFRPSLKLNKSLLLIPENRVQIVS